MYLSCRAEQLRTTKKGSPNWRPFFNRLRDEDQL